MWRVSSSTVTFLLVLLGTGHVDDANIKILYEAPFMSTPTESRAARGYLREHSGACSSGQSTQRQTHPPKDLPLCGIDPTANPMPRSPQGQLQTGPVTLPAQRSAGHNQSGNLNTTNCITGSTQPFEKRVIFTLAPAQQTYQSVAAQWK